MCEFKFVANGEKIILTTFVVMLRNCYGPLKNDFFHIKLLY